MGVKLKSLKLLMNMRRLIKSQIMLRLIKSKKKQINKVMSKLASKTGSLPCKTALYALLILSTSVLVFTWYLFYFGFYEFGWNQLEIVHISGSRCMKGFQRLAIPVYNNDSITGLELNWIWKSSKNSEYTLLINLNLFT